MTAAPTLADLGLSAEVTLTLDRAHADRLARTLDFSDQTLDDGTLPLTWVWVYFSPTAATADLRADGHPRVGPESPLAGLDRRMWVSGGLERAAEPLRLDQPTVRHSAVVSATEKQGSTGSFLLVEVEHRYEQAGATRVTERQTVMYRAAPSDSVPEPGEPKARPESAGPRRDLTPDERLLFRYSALTFNTHRIHYDVAYANQAEGYPGLVVHGPLTATLLAELAETALGRPLGSFSFRATAPTFAGVALHLVCEDERPEGATDGSGVAVRAVRSDGATVMTAVGRLLQ